MPLPHPHPDLASLDLLVSVGELGSISAAAEAHHITQPAASMRLRALERTLGVRLLDRLRTGARLTPAGDATVEWATDVLRDMRTLMTGAAALRAGQRSQLRVSASLTVAEYLLPRWLEQLATKWPHVKVALKMGNTAHVASLVAGGSVDVGFVEGPHYSRRLRSREVAHDELVVVVGPEHPWRRRHRPLMPHQLASAPLVLREPGSGTRDVLTEALAEHALAPSTAMEFSSTTAIKTAVMAGVGPTVLSSLAIAGELRTGQLAVVPCDGLRLRRTIRAIWAPGRPLSAPATRLLAIAASRPPHFYTG